MIGNACWLKNLMYKILWCGIWLNKLCEKWRAVINKIKAENGMTWCYCIRSLTWYLMYKFKLVSWTEWGNYVPSICVYLLYCVGNFIFFFIFFFTLDARLLARSQYSEGPATGHLDTGFSWFPCVYKNVYKKCWDGSQDSKLQLHASHVALPT